MSWPTWVAKNSRPDHQDGCSGAHTLGSGVKVNAAVHFKVAFWVSAINKTAQFVYAPRTLWQERLATETGMHGHAQRQVDFWKIWFQRGQRRFRIDRQPDL